MKKILRICLMHGRQSKKRSYYLLVRKAIKILPLGVLIQENIILYVQDP
ncbi:unnamed protein product [Larinioides sclopetarius]|uniref:Ribosomal protein S16 n=1 Tax=Larinioides sclopetarius TaxID=280406 RepID=A0AAV2B6A4_9ARAC